MNEDRPKKLRQQPLVCYDANPLSRDPLEAALPKSVGDGPARTRCYFQKLFELILGVCNELAYSGLVFIGVGRSKMQRVLRHAFFDLTTLCRHVGRVCPVVLDYRVV